MELHDCSFKDKNQRRDYWMDLRRRGKEWRPERSAATDQVYNTRYDSDYEWERRFERHQVAGHVRYQSSKLSGHRIDDRYCTTGHEYRRRDHYTHPYYDYSYHYERRQPPQYGYYHYEGAGRSNGGYHQRQQFKDFFATESSRESKLMQTLYFYDDIPQQCILVGATLTICGVQKENPLILKTGERK